MTPTQWKHVIWFEPWEFDDPNYPGSGEHIDGKLVLLLDKLRITINSPVIPHWEVGGCVDMDGSWGHSAESYHLFGKGCRAADFHIKTHKNLREQYNIVCQCGFGGIGAYAWWANPGFHVDVRPIELTQHWHSPVKRQYDYLLP